MSEQERLLNELHVIHGCLLQKVAAKLATQDDIDELCSIRDRIESIMNDIDKLTKCQKA